MKKNEKGFMQEEKNLEKVSGGAMASGVEVGVDFKARDINAKVELIKAQRINANQTVNGDYNQAYNMSTNSING